MSWSSFVALFRSPTVIPFLSFHLSTPHSLWGEWDCQFQMELKSFPFRMIQCSLQPASLALSVLSETRSIRSGSAHWTLSQSKWIRNARHDTHNTRLESRINPLPWVTEGVSSIHSLHFHLHPRRDLLPYRDGADWGLCLSLALPFMTKYLSTRR